MFGLRSRQREERVVTPAWGEWPGEGSSTTWAGVSVDAKKSLQLLTVYGSARFIADGISAFPLDTYRKAGTERIAIPTPPWLEADRMEWMGQTLISLLLAGNAYLHVVRDSNAPDRISHLVALDPTAIQPVRVQGQRRFMVNGQEFPGEILHIPGIMWPGAECGLSPVEAARQSIGMGMATQEFGARFFGQGAVTSGVLEVEGELTDDQARRMARAWSRAHGGKSRSHLPGVLEGGAKWKPTQVTNEQAQFLETRGYTAAEIAGQMFLIDPSELGIPVAGTSLTYANLDQRNTRRVQVTFTPWMVRIERALSARLASPRYVKFNADAVLRGDTKSRYETHAIGIASKFLTPNEARQLEDMPPIDGGDEFPAAAPTGGINAQPSS